jgi:hypothetical protein
MKSKAQDITIMTVNQLLERLAITRFRLFDEKAFLLG